jgi:hypothetical protein
MENFWQRNQLEYVSEFRSSWSNIWSSESDSLRNKFIKSRLLLNCFETLKLELNPDNRSLIEWYKFMIDKLTPDDCLWIENAKKLAKPEPMIEELEHYDDYYYQNLNYHLFD